MQNTASIKRRYAAPRLSTPARELCSPAGKIPNGVEAGTVIFYSGPS